MKPTWTSDCGRVQLYLGDCREILPTLGKVDAVVTDPPYGIGANKQTLGKGKKNFHRGEDWDSKAPDIRPLIESAPLQCFWGGNYFADQIPTSNDWLIWHKLNDGRSFSECEMAWTNFGMQTRHFKHHWGGEDKEHPTQKPLPVMTWCLTFIPDAKTILDPFMGSGTTAVACIRTGRRFIGIEIEPCYFQIAKERIQRELAQPFLIEPKQEQPKQIEMV